MNEVEKLSFKSEKGIKLLLENCEIIWNVLQMVALQQKR